MPLYYLVLSLFVLLAIGHPDKWITSEAHSLPTLALAVTLTQTWFNNSTIWNSPAWSLSAEWFAYACFPVLIFLTTRISTARVAIAMIVLAMLALVGFLYLRGKPDLTQVARAGIVRCIAEFFAGALLARLVSFKVVSVLVANVCFAVGLIILGIIAADGAPDLYALVALPLVILGTASGGAAIQWLLGNRTAHFLGEVSFSVYLLHWLFIEAVFRITSSKEARAFWLITMPIYIVGAAWMTWRYVEVPGQAVGRQLQNAFRRRPSFS